jgi:hypothetical protein
MREGARIARSNQAGQKLAQQADALFCEQVEPTPFSCSTKFIEALFLLHFSIFWKFFSNCVPILKNALSDRVVS